MWGRRGNWEFGAVGRKSGEGGRRRIGNQKLREGAGRELWLAERWWRR